MLSVPGPVRRVRRAALLLLSAVLAACGSADSPTAPERPNLVVIVMDTTRADRCSVNGYGRPTTPELEKVAAEGVVYRSAWTPSPWTGPSHGSLFTGLRPEHHGFYTAVKNYLELDQETLADVLGRAGYGTACVSCNPIVSSYYQLTQGFDLVSNVTEEADPGYPMARWAHGRAVEYVRTMMGSRRPFFLFVNDTEPHLPYTPTAEWKSRFVAPDAVPEYVRMCEEIVGGPTLAEYALGLWRLPPKALPVFSDLYDAEIAGLDHEIGSLLRRLEEMGAMKNTILVVLSDHGENLGDHGLVDHIFSLHATLLRTLLVIRAPGRLPEGEVVREVVRIEDVFPTVLELCGLPIPAGLDGETLTGPLGGRIARAIEGPYRAKGAFVEDFPEYADSPLLLPHESVFDGRWHLTHREDGQIELFDLAADPEELENLADRHPEEVERLRPLLPVPR